MSSRKTYFGIGVPGQGPQPTEKLPDDDDDERSDYSAPTVVDDAKVAEGLKQLRAWYKPEAGGTDDDRESVVDSPSEPTKLGMPYPRPTAVGHSTSDVEQTEQRSVPQDPMRGTMFGHDVHRPELDDSSGPIEASVSATAQPAEAVPRNAETTRNLAWRAQTAGSRGAGEAPFADFLRREAARPRPAGGFHLSHEDTDSIAVSRRHITTNVLLAVFGVGAVVGAVMLGLRTGAPEPVPAEAMAGTTAPAPAGTAAGDVTSPSPAGQGTVTKSVTPVLPAAEVPAPPAQPAQRVTDVPRAPTGRPAASETPARAAQPDVPRRTVAKPPVGRTGDAEQRSEPGETTEAAADTTETAPPAERAEARPLRSGRDRSSRKPEREKSPEEKDPDSTLPPSEE